MSDDFLKKSRRERYEVRDDVVPCYKKAFSQKVFYSNGFRRLYYYVVKIHINEAGAAPIGRPLLLL